MNCWISELHSNLFSSVQIGSRDFSHLPPEQRKRKLAKKIGELEGTLNKTTSDRYYCFLAATINDVAHSLPEWQWRR